MEETLVKQEVDRIAANVTAALTAIVEKGVTVPDGADSDDLAELIGQFMDLNYETWVFELEDGSTVEKEVYVG